MAKKKPPKPQNELTPLQVGQQVFRDWCQEVGAVVEVSAAAMLVTKITTAITYERAERSR